MEFTCNLQPDEYRRAMVWFQFASSMGKRINDYIGWVVLVLAPLMILFYLLVAPEALTIWFWPIAVIAIGYAAYSTLFVRYQIRQRANALPETHPILAHTRYRIHEKGINLRDAEAENPEAKLFLPWKEIQDVRELPDLFLLFTSTETILIIPKRCVPNLDHFRRLAQHAGQ